MFKELRLGTALAAATALLLTGCGATHRRLLGASSAA